jgi:hypothetical protein
MSYFLAQMEGKAFTIRFLSFFIHVKRPTEAVQEFKKTDTEKTCNTAGLALKKF